MHWSGVHVGVCACVHARVVSTPALLEFETHAGHMSPFPFLYVSGLLLYGVGIFARRARRVRRPRDSRTRTV